MSFLDQVVSIAESSVDHPDCLSFFSSRGISPDSIKKARVGFIDKDFPLVEDHIESHEYCHGDLKCDYCRFKNWFYWERSGEQSCRFSKYVLFPLTDFKNRIVGFSLRGVEKKSFESFLSRRDFNAVLFKTTDATRESYEQGCIWIVEGPMDLLSMTEVGLINSVAIMTNNLSRNQTKWIKRVSDRFYLAMDADEAGNLGASNAKIRFGESNCKRIKWSQYSQCKDMNDLLKKLGPTKLRKLLDGEMT